MIIVNRFFVFCFLFLSSGLALSQPKEINIIFINGIQNTYLDARDSKTYINKVLFESSNHDNRIKFNYDFVWNPIGFHGDTEWEADYFQDSSELFLLKTAEEIFAVDFELLIAPHFNINENIGNTLNIEKSAKEVVRFIDVMTPDGNRLVDLKKVTTDDMFLTQSAINRLYTKLKESSFPVVLVAHSQGNLLANLAYAKLIDSIGYEKAKNQVRIVNVANTSLFSVHSLDFTHISDYAIKIMSSLPSSKGYRTTPVCTRNICSFKSSPPTFIPDEDIEIPTIPNHSFIQVYLSGLNISSQTTAGYDQKIKFTKGKTLFSDRFEDFIYTAANSFKEKSVERFEKISNDECVKDNQTGLTWEIVNNNKRYDNYTWYEPDNSKNSGYAGNLNIGDDMFNCDGFKLGDINTYCNTNSYAKSFNKRKVCGYSDWRLPSTNELLSIIDDDFNPPVNPNYFPNIIGYESKHLFTDVESNHYWTSNSLSGESNDRVEKVRFKKFDDDTYITYGFKDNHGSINLVRGVK